MDPPVINDEGFDEKMPDADVNLDDEEIEFPPNAAVFPHYTQLARQRANPDPCKLRIGNFVVIPDAQFTRKDVPASHDVRVGLIKAVHRMANNIKVQWWKARNPRNESAIVFRKTHNPAVYDVP